MGYHLLKRWKEARVFTAQAAAHVARWGHEQEQWQSEDAAGKGSDNASKSGGGLHEPERRPACE